MLRRLRVAVLAAAMLTVTCPATAQAEALPDKPAVYNVGTQRDLRVTMRDGTVLKADVHYPVDKRTGQKAPGPFPVLLTQSPYAKWAPVEFMPNLVALRQDYFVQRGYIEVVADVRGSGASEGDFGLWSPEQATDGADLVNWAAKLPDSTGTVGTYGLSYLGMNQFFTAGALGRNSPLKAIVPGAAANDMLRDTAAMGGMWHMPALLGFVPGTYAMTVLNPLLNSGWDQLHGAKVDYPEALRRFADHLKNSGKSVPPLLQQVISGEGKDVYDGPLWQAMKPGEQLQQVVDNDIPALLYSGWNDDFQRGALRNYAGLQNAAAGRPVDAPMVPGQPVTGRYQLVYGSGNHLNSTGPLDQLRLHQAWFDRWLKDEHNGIDETSNPLHLNVYDSKQWVETTNYPFTGTPTRYYLSGDHRLGNTAPAQGSDRLDYSPINISCGRNLNQWTIGLLPAVCDHDDRITQLGAQTYTTEPLTADKLLAGPMSATIKATANTTNTALVVNIQDIAPDGRSRPLAEGALDGKSRVLNQDRTWRADNGAITVPFRDLTAQSEKPVVPGEPTEYVVEIFPTLAKIPAGHRIRVTIGTADFPVIMPTLKQYQELQGGHYDLRWGSFVDLPLVEPGALSTPCGALCVQR
ncbi:CocE/NonD family hydrolase [Pseudonocardiaceae bacterium YIM PH 21723]|nr:CocE/NonD family hydrolase [Pseudonocardiaceae bacterium YIM PH 21723]